MPVLHPRAGPRFTDTEFKRILPAIIIGVVAFLLLILWACLRQRAQQRHGLETHRLVASSGRIRWATAADFDDQNTNRVHNRQAREAEELRLQEVVRSAEERRRLEVVYLEQLNRELAAEGQVKPPGYVNVDGVGSATAAEIARPAPVAGRLGDEELPSYAPRSGGANRATDEAAERARVATEDAAVAAVVADPPPAYTPGPGAASLPPTPATATNRSDS